MFLTADRRLQFQQNLQRFDIGVVIIQTISLRFRVINTALDAIRTALAAVESGKLIQIEVMRKLGTEPKVR